MLRIAQAAFGALVVLYVIGINEENKELKAKNAVYESRLDVHGIKIEFHK